jgi:hypothetical protein
MWISITHIICFYEQVFLFRGLGFYKSTTLFVDIKLPYTVE